MAGSTFIQVTRGKRNLKAKKGFKLKRPRRSFTSKFGHNKINSAVSQVGFPQIAYKSLTYSDFYNITQGVVQVPKAHQWRMGSIYDPDVTNVGSDHSPLWRDELVSLYSSYQVLSVKYNFEVSSSSSEATMIVLRSSRESTVPTSLTLESERRGSKTKMITADRAARFRGTIYPWKVLGIPKHEYIANLDYITANSATNPSIINYLNVIFQAVDSLTLATLNFKIQLVYNVRYSNLVNPIQS